MKENLLHESNDWHFGRSIRHWSRLGMMLFLLVGAGIGGCFEAFASNGNVVDYYKQPIGEKGQFVHETHYDYSEVARVITSGCTTDYEKIRAIYQWLCANISYDTSYTIRTADQCFDAKRGVCQGYCELFYQIAKAAGVTAEIVGGKSKNQYGVIGQEGHLMALVA